MVYFFVSSAFTQEDDFYGRNIFIEDNASQKIRDIADEFSSWLKKGTGKEFSVVSTVPKTGVFLLKPDSLILRSKIKAKRHLSSVLKVLKNCLLHAILMLQCGMESINTLRFLDIDSFSRTKTGLLFQNWKKSQLMQIFHNFLHSKLEISSAQVGLVVNCLLTLK